MNNLDSRSLLALEINNQLASSGTESDFYQQELNPAKTIINQSSKLKKTVPFLAILFFLVALTLGFLFLTPSLLINHFVQTLTERFNYQAPSLEARSNILLNNKWLDHSQPSTYKIINEYRQISPNLVSKLEGEGFSITTENNQISRVFFKNRPVSREQFLHLLKTDLDINEAKNNSFNAKRVVFQDQVWQKNASNLNLSKKGFHKSTATAKQAIFDDFKQQELEITKVPIDQIRFNTDNASNPNSQDSQTSNQGLLASLLENLRYINTKANDFFQKKQSPYYQSVDNLKFAEADFINNQSACGLYQNSRFLQNYAKTYQANQQSQLALNLIIEAEKIKAGIATPESTSFYGDRLTKTFTTTKKNGVTIETKSATDSIGYKYAAFGDTPELNETSERYVLGANPTIAKTLKTIDNNQNQCQKTTSFKDILNNFFSNIINFLNPFKINNQSLNNLLNSGKDRQITENTLASITHMKVNPETAGEDLGNAITAGTSFFLGKNAAIGGNNILTKKQAVAYLQQQQDFIAFQGKIEGRKLSPFNPYSKYTLVGSLIANNLHFFTKFNSVSSLIKPLLQSTKSSLSIILPITQAKTLSVAVNHNRCQDDGFLKLNQYLNGEEIAFDIFCNPVYGVNPDVLESDPIQVVNKLISSGDLVKTDQNCQQDCELKPAKGLAKYQKNCINRHNLPIGNQDQENNLDDGESCLSNSPQKSLYAIYFIDRRLQDIFMAL